MKHTMRQVALFTMLVMLVAGCRTMTGQSLGTNVDNATTTAAVKTALTSERLQNLTWVGVDTNDGVVYLTGTATSETQKQRAAELAGNVTGVKRVVNNIQVQSAATGSSSAPSASPPGTAAGTSGAFQGTMTGVVSEVDRAHGHVRLDTAEGDMLLRLPPAALSNIKAGDRVTVDVGIRPAQ